MKKIFKPSIAVEENMILLDSVENVQQNNLKIDYFNEEEACF